MNRKTNNIAKSYIFFVIGLLLKKALVLICFMSVCISYAAENDQGISESDLIDKYIHSLPYSSSIVFSPSNIKQYWIDKTVSSQNNTINILLNNHVGNKNASASLPIKLINVDETLDCTVIVLSNNTEMPFSVSNNKSNVVSQSSPQTKFLNYSISSSSFHLEDTAGLSFNLQFISDNLSVASIKRIVLAFSKNEQSNFLLPPIKMEISKDMISCSDSTKIDASSFIITGKQSQIYSNKKILVQDNVFQSSVKVSNIGKTRTLVYLGYRAYSADGMALRIENYPYQNNNQILSVVSAPKGQNSIIVDSYPEKWAPQCHIALNAKEDLSDIPNTSILNGTGGFILEVKKKENGHGEIILNSALSKEIPSGTKIRVHATFSGNLYPVTKVLKPGEEAILNSTIQKDSNYLEYSSKAFSRGVYYVQPLLFSYSSDTNEENTVQISDFSISTYKD